jgi:hypothetical protein
MATRALSVGGGVGSALVAAAAASPLARRCRTRSRTHARSHAVGGHCDMLACRRPANLAKALVPVVRRGFDLILAVLIVTCPFPNRSAEKKGASSAHPRVLTLEEVQMTKGGSAGRGRGAGRPGGCAQPVRCSARGVSLRGDRCRPRRHWISVRSWPPMGTESSAARWRIWRAPKRSDGQPTGPRQPRRPGPG